MTKYKVVPAEMSNDKMREEFDSWIERQGMSTMKDGETYYDHTTHAAWQAWKASRAAPAMQGEPVGWYTEDHLDDKSATTYNAEVAQRWRAKGWPVTPLYTAPQPVELKPDATQLVELLSHARCNTCDGSGGFYDNHGHAHQCQWCHDRSKTLAVHRKEGDV